MTITCPTCGQPWDPPNNPDFLVHLDRLSTYQRTIVEALLDGWPRPKTMERLIYEVYGARQKDEPDWPSNVISVGMHKIRPIIEAHGWTIPRNGSGRGNIARYTLVPVE